MATALMWVWHSPGLKKIKELEEENARMKRVYEHISKACRLLNHVVMNPAARHFMKGVVFCFGTIAMLLNLLNSLPALQLLL